jgi:hypothetical protein
VDAICGSQPHGGTLMGAAVTKLKHEAADRFVALTP